MSIQQLKVEMFLILFSPFKCSPWSVDHSQKGENANVGAEVVIRMTRCVRQLKYKNTPDELVLYVKFVK